MGVSLGSLKNANGRSHICAHCNEGHCQWQAVQKYSQECLLNTKNTSIHSSDGIPYTSWFWASNAEHELPWNCENAFSNQAYRSSYFARVTNFKTSCNQLQRRWTWIEESSDFTFNFTISCNQHMLLWQNNAHISRVATSSVVQMDSRSTLWRMVGLLPHRRTAWFPGCKSAA